MIQVNLIGTLRCIAKAAAGMIALPPLVDGERGAIVNTASVAAQDGQMGQAAYSASKAGIVGVTLVVARDLMGDGIRANTILPGIFDTPLLARAPERVKAGLAASVPFPKRLGRPDEYAALAEQMITNGYFNGESVRLDGAIRMAPRRRIGVPLRRHPRGMGWRRRRFSPRGRPARRNGTAGARRHEHRRTFDRGPLPLEPRH